jgi:hypothetical protein
VAVAVLPALGGITGLSYLHPAALAYGFQRAVLIAAALCALGGLIAAVGIRNRPAGAAGEQGVRTGSLSHCALDATPLAAGVTAGAPPAGGGHEGLTSSS